MTEQRHEDPAVHETHENWWQKTRKTFHQATFQAGKYRRIAQRKIDLATLHRKIALTQSELGKQIDESRAAGQHDLLNDEKVQQVIQRLDSFKNSAATLLQEIEAIRDESPLPHESASEEKPPVHH